ncbi:MAG: hypothetical protein PHY48_07725 [Candidatus Cloacimonetes bacterium]|nr:hypothetical protein [Candidatus Cloacimonadota bacterium]
MKKVLLLILLSVLWLALTAIHNTNVILCGLSDAGLNATMQHHLSELITGFNKAYAGKDELSVPSGSISSAAAKSLNEMWKGKSFLCPETELILNVIKRCDGNYEVRNIPILYETKSKDALDDELVIVFDTAGIIQGVLIALEREKYTQMFADAYTLQDRRLREIILNFIENFRTAYNRKDISYLDQVFSDDALIIVGRVLSSQQKLPDQLDKPVLKLSDDKNVEYVKLKKSQYISNLRKLFAKNRFVKVEFAGFKIQQHHSKPNFYGVQLFQKWRSSTYSDDGYLFLLIDLRDEDKPIIWVRTWQPGEFTKPGEAFDLADFTLN